ncbi:ferredoxin [Sporolactobacillus spathodeae]|uniref:Ferredoxin n=1 Tax=Sporolactobacillus spathodeae TaxID=1465502 RepID=A0ABS2Q922_9BACL|nr:ferredoxin [Sporolactobacillus spathodeae]MBM7658121.1 ferredoxin [Sporolactobacillus spathodeae]
MSSNKKYTFTLVDKETCISCGACQMAAPDIFGEDDDGLSFSLIDDNKGIKPIPEDLLDDLEDACDGCPTESILVSNHPFSADAVEQQAE